MRRSALLALLLLAPPLTGVWAQKPAAPPVQNATLRRALSAYDNLDYNSAITLGQQALKEHLSGNHLPARGCPQPWHS